MHPSILALRKIIQNTYTTVPHKQWAMLYTLNDIERELAIYKRNMMNAYMLLIAFAIHYIGSFVYFYIF